MSLTTQMKPWVVKSYDIYRRNKYLLIFLPALLVVTVFFFVPIITLFRISFYEYTGMGVFEPAFNLSGYIKFLTDPFYIKIILDGFVKSLKSSFDVVPAKAGTQCFQIVLDACLRRHDGVSDFLRVCQYSMLDVRC